MVFPLLRLSAGVITFRIGDFGFRSEHNKIQIKNSISIPQSAFRIPKSAIELLQSSKTARNLYRQSHSTLTPARLDLGVALRVLRLIL